MLSILAEKPQLIKKSTILLKNPVLHLENLQFCTIPQLKFLAMPMGGYDYYTLRIYIHTILITFLVT